MRITSKGQVTIPAEIRERAGLLPHTEVEFEFDGEAVRIVRATARKGDGRGVRLVANLLGRGDVAMSTDAIMALTRAPQIIRTPSGEELVVLPRAEYEALLERADHAAEDADDVAIYDARKAELVAGGVVLPPEVSAAILRGDGRLKAIRNWRGETQLHLNFLTGIGQGYLSDLESGRRTGTPETIAKLAQALNVPVEWLSQNGWAVRGSSLAGPPSCRPFRPARSSRRR